MYHLVMVVLAILLAGLLAVGGISYVNQDTALRVEVNRTLDAHADLLTGAVAVYKSANNGIFPHPEERLYGFLPGGNMPVLPKTMGSFTWKTVKDDPVIRGICISGSHDNGLNSDVVAGVTNFAKMRARNLPGSVLYSDNCELTGFSTGDIDQMEPGNLTNDTSVAVVIKDQ